MTKPKAAFFDFTCCEGCQLSVLGCEDELLDLLGHIEIVNFREAMTEKRDDYDIAFVEGSITRNIEIERIKSIRKKAKVVTALGSCAAISGINAIKNRFSMEEVKTIVYGDDNAQIDTIPAMPIDDVIKADYYLLQCPIDRSEFLRFVKDILMGKKPFTPDHPVCVDCKLAENQCVYERGMTCVGLITRGGCSAICVTYGSKCWGCRGMISNPNLNSQKDVLNKYGLSIEEIVNSMGMYNTNSLVH